MKHVDHIRKNKKNLELRMHIIQYIREFFISDGFLEAETPIFLRLPGQEPYLSPVRATMHNENGQELGGYLHTSPEYTMKKMLAAGFEKIFSICKCFRDYESFGGLHNPEFTMLEWYRNEKDFFAIMDDCENLFKYILNKLASQHSLRISLDSGIARFTMKEIWMKYVGVNLDDYLIEEKMHELCIQLGYKPKENEPYEDLFYRIFLNKIEPNLGIENPVIIYNYPAQMASLARLNQEDPRYAERFELYANGIELANAFSELTDSVEQEKRLLEEKKLRQKLNKDVYDIDHEFVSSLTEIKSAAGIALGVDRLIQVLLGCKNIDEVLVLPMSLLIN